MRGHSAATIASFLKIPPELKDRMAACTDPAQCEKLMADEINRALECMSQMDESYVGATTEPEDEPVVG